MVCLDTDVIIDYLKNERSIFEIITSLKDREQPLFTTTINSFELYRGNLRISKKSQEDAVELFLNSVAILNFTLEASEKAAEIFEQLKAAGAMIELTDIMIAAICISRNESLLTRNTRHFERIPGLKLEPFERE